MTVRRRPRRLRVLAEGQLEVIDPGLDVLGLLEAVSPDFRIEHAPLAGFVRPRLHRTRRVSGGVADSDLAVTADAELWARHAAALSADRFAPPGAGEASLLDVKRELARRALASCCLCAHRCGVDRTRGHRGACRLGASAVVGEHFVHIGEEAPINPSLVIGLAGCGLRCRYCQQGELLDPDAAGGVALAPALWAELELAGARSLSFVGGNPDESLPAIVEFLAASPADWALPLVWNCHAFSTAETLSLLDGVVDVYVPDFKYGDDACAARWSAAPGYTTHARAAIAAMVAQGAVVIVRLLVLPGHVECCHAPALAFLATLPQAGLLVSVRGQYAPDWRITTRDGAMARRPTTSEIEAVREHARSHRLRLVDETT